MNNTQRQGTFWVIDGIRVKKKQPFITNQIPRILQLPPPQKPQPSYLPIQPPQPLNQSFHKNFFTQKSSQYLGNKDMDYGLIRCSSLSSMRGEKLFRSFHVAQQENRGFMVYNYEEYRVKQRSSIFQNVFCGFEYVPESVEVYGDQEEISYQ